jgi:hypothetical protein
MIQNSVLSKTGVLHLYTFEILIRTNIFSGMRLSIKKLSTAMTKLKYGDSFSKRINESSPRKVFSVLERNEIK